MSPYRDPTQPLSARVDDLVSQMTLPEKVGQLLHLDGNKTFRELIRNKHVGALLHLNGADADAAIEAGLETRLGIPILLGDDAIHGHSFWAGATIFPTQLGLACSWDSDLIEEVARVTAREMRVTGLKWTFSPVLCLTRDLRWGRVDETFGEDPFLIGEFASAMIRGYQGKGLDDPEAVMATAKHFAGYSETLGGRDASEADLSRRRLRSYFFPPFERAVAAGCMTFMTGYQSIDGIPSTADSWLLREVLRDEWGFEGIVVTDWDNVGHLYKNQRVAADVAEAAALAIRSGNDMMMATPEFFEGCQEAVARGLISEADIDRPLKRILALKFRLGLFENPGKSQPEKLASVIASPEHRDVNLRAARESLVLLRNAARSGNPVLPLDAGKPAKIAVIGPNADNPLSQLGDWSLGSGQMTSPSGPAHPRASVLTVLDGVKAVLPPSWKLVSEKEADYIVLVIGDSLAYTGEGKSTATLELQDGQIALCERVTALGKPVIAVLINSKPLVLPKTILEADAIIEVFNPGMQGGLAVAEAIFGLINPSGKLTVSFPYHVGQQPVYYNQVRGQHGDRYADLSQEPAFAFGFGLSYTTFKMEKCAIRKDHLKQGDTLELDIVIRNSGQREGVEVVQLYIEDDVTSLTWARRELKAFSRVSLAAGETRTVSLSLPVRALSIVDGSERRVVEPGKFRAMVGNSSRNADLTSVDFWVE